jgi:hypothetical protein
MIVAGNGASVNEDIRMRSPRPPLGRARCKSSAVDSGIDPTYREDDCRTARMRGGGSAASVAFAAIDGCHEPRGGARDMITITFPDRDTEKRALAYLLGRFSGGVLRSGEHLVPEAALEALADQNIPFSVKGKAT